MLLLEEVAVKFTVEDALVKVPPVASQLPETEMVWVLVAVKVPLMSTSVREMAPEMAPTEKVLPVQTKNSELVELAVKVPAVELATYSM